MSGRVLHLCVHAFIIGASWMIAVPPAAADDDGGCFSMYSAGFLPIATERAERFLGKVQPATARCRGGDSAVARRPEPWVDWQNYYATRDSASRAFGPFADLPLFGANSRGLTGALLDLEYQRIELIRFNLFDNSGTFEQYAQPNGQNIT